MKVDVTCKKCGQKKRMEMGTPPADQPLDPPACPAPECVEMFTDEGTTPCLRVCPIEGDGCLGGDELKGQSTHAPSPRHLDGVDLGARNPERGVRLLEGFGEHVAEGKIEVLAVVFMPFRAEHGHDGPDGILPDGALVAEAPIEGVQLGDRRSFSDPEFDAAMAEEIQGGDSFGHASRVVGGELDDPVRQANLLGALAGRGQEDFGCRRVGILLQEVMLYLPGEVVAETIGQFDFVEGVLE